jgi:hypothetical protein
MSINMLSNVLLRSPLLQLWMYSFVSFFVSTEVSNLNFIDPFFSSFFPGFIGYTLYSDSLKVFNRYFE